MQDRRPSRAEIVFLIGVPLAWAVVLLFHPTGDGEDFYPIVRDQLTAWMTVHVATLPSSRSSRPWCTCCCAASKALRRRSAGSRSRPFVLFYATWEALIGLGVGVLADEVNGLPVPEQDAGGKVLEDFADSGIIRAFELIGTGSLFGALTAAGIALRRRAGAPLAVPVLLVLAAVPIAWHVRPFGQIGLALLIAAVLLVVQARPVPSVPAAAAGRPTAA